MFFYDIENWSKVCGNESRRPADSISSLKPETIQFRKAYLQVFKMTGTF